MTRFLPPGTYVEDPQLAWRSIEGVVTALPAFIGLAQLGDFDQPTLVTDWRDFARQFGGSVDGGYLANAIFGYFNNGGKVCYVVRIGRDSPRSLRPEPGQSRGVKWCRPEDFIGEAAARTGLKGLETLDTITMVTIPDLMGAYSEGLFDLDDVEEVQQAATEHCERMGDRMVILDSPAGLDARQILKWRREKVGNSNSPPSFGHGSRCVKVALRRR